MEVLKQLEKRLQTEWTEAMKAKRSDDIQALRAKALETYRRIKLQKELIGVN